MAQDAECTVTPIADTPSTLPTVTVQWRVEVQKRGKYWQWRRGSRQKRVSRYGGKFELLSEERKAEYAVNKAKWAQRRSNSNNGTGGTATVTERHWVPTTGRDNGTGSEQTRWSAIDHSGSVLFGER